MTLKTMPKFGNGDGNWSKTKDLLYILSFIGIKDVKKNSNKETKKFNSNKVEVIYGHSDGWLKRSGRIWNDMERSGTTCNGQ